MRKVITVLCRFSRERRIIQKKKSTEIAHPPSRSGLMLSASYFFTAFAWSAWASAHTHTVLCHTAGPALPTCGLLHLTSCHLSSHLTFEETLLPPLQRCARARGVRAPLPTCHSSLHRLGAGHLIPSSNLTLVVFSLFFWQEREEQLRGRNAWRQRSQLQTLAARLSTQRLCEKTTRE